jgi:hypothetical protein
VIAHTGQHFDKGMSDVFFDELNIPAPKHHLDIHRGSHGEMTGRMLIATEPVMMKENPIGSSSMAIPIPRWLAPWRQQSFTSRLLMWKQVYGLSIGECRKRSTVF